MNKVLLLIAGLFGVFLSLSAHEELHANFGTGYIPFSHDELKEIERAWPRIVGVRHNKLGLARVQQHLKSLGFGAQEVFQPAQFDEELITQIGAFSVESAEVNASDVVALPPSVNNAKLPSFPPIGNQQSEGSCVGWATTYYQASHEIGLLNGFNNKANNQHVLSPRWTYNILNGGYDQGLVPGSAYLLLTQNGAPSISAFPYINGEFRSWDLNPQDWIAAIYNRMGPVQYISGIGGAAQNLQTIKQVLVNGHVLGLGTFIYSWVFNRILNDPENPNGPYVGQQACTYMNGTSGGHFLTIVGYDDNLWIDVNGNGRVDPGERGAFLIANSWGSSWGNSGFTWISYDAFLNTSAVPNGPSANRVPVAGSQNNYVFSILPKAVNYAPKLVGQFGLNQSVRNQIIIQGGLSSTVQTVPTSTFNCYALKNQGGPFEFDGTAPAAPKTATFAVDMTDFLSAATTPQRYYLVTSDSAAGNPTTLTSFSLLDLVHNKQVSYAQVPLKCDNSKVTPYIDYAFSNSADVTPPVVSISAPANNATVQNSINIDVTASDDVAVARVELYVDSTLYATDTSAPYLFTLDTTRLSNGAHQLTAKAYDSSGNSAQSTIAVTVSNSAFVIRVNCSGSDVTYNGLNYKADYAFSGTSYTYTSSNVRNVNPVYMTSRYGPNFSYNFTVPNGNYSVTLKCIETYFNQASKRIFSASINGSWACTNVDIWKLVGFLVPYDLTVPVSVTNGKISINLVSTIDNATISGIEIIGTN